MNWKIISSVTVALAVIGGIFVLYLVNTMPQRADDTFATSEGINNVVKANNQFCLELYYNLKEKETGNIFFSPYNISTCFAMMYEGAQGETAKEIQSIFHFPENESLRRSSFAALYNKINKKDAEYQLNMGNALWIQQDYKILDKYLKTIENYYLGKVTNVNFREAAEETRKKINSWVENKTNGKIKDLFSPDSLSSLNPLVLITVIYFKGNWVKQFDKEDTKEENFRINTDHSIKVSMMSLTDRDTKFNYSETDNLQMLEMLYKGEELSMLVLLPKNYDLRSLENSLTIDNFNKWKNQLKEQIVNVFMPKFAFSTQYSLNHNLVKLGMISAFSANANFSGIDGTKNLFIQKVVHKAFVEVNEEGTEAIAVTSGIKAISVVKSEEIITFRADHPFIFIIQEKETGNILFIGRVIDPTR